MAEYINKADMWEAYGKAKDDIDMAEQFERLPTIDIVTCKECKHARTFYVGESTHAICEHPSRYALERHRLNWFCADGERRTE